LNHNSEKFANQINIVMSGIVPIYCAHVINSITLNFQASPKNNLFETLFGIMVEQQFVKVGKNK
jgi:hypothetical protein